MFLKFVLFPFLSLLLCILQTTTHVIQKIIQYFNLLFLTANIISFERV